MATALVGAGWQGAKLLGGKTHLRIQPVFFAYPLVPWSYEIDPDRDIVLVKATGIVTENDIRSGAAKAYADPRFHPDLRAFIDYSAVTDWKVSTEFSTRMAAGRRFSAKSRTAMLAVGALVYGMMRAYQSWVDNGQVAIFSDRAKALAWLNEGVPPEKHIT